MGTINLQCTLPLNADILGMLANKSCFEILAKKLNIKIIHPVQLDSNQALDVSIDVESSTEQQKQTTS